MDIVEIAYIANSILIFVMAIGLALFLIRRFKLGWRLFFIGGATYLAAQMISILLMGFLQNFIQSVTSPAVMQLLLTLLFVIILISIEECVRYGMYRWWAKENRSWGEGLVIGAGHGGLEVIFLGLIALSTMIHMFPLRYGDLSTVFAPEDLEQATEVVTAYWSIPWYNVFIESVRSALTLPIQLACSLLVLQVFIRQQNRWLGYAFGWHTLASIPLFFISSEKYVYLPFVFFAIATLGSVVIIGRLQPQSEETNEGLKTS